MNVADEAKMVVDGESIMSRTIDSSGNFGLPTSREMLPVPPGYGQSQTVEGSYSSSVKIFLLVA